MIMRMHKSFDELGNAVRSVKKALVYLTNEEYTNPEGLAKLGDIGKYRKILNELHEKAIEANSMCGLLLMNDELDNEK